jgi:hypothetical protein
MVELFDVVLQVNVFAPEAVKVTGLLAHTIPEDCEMLMIGRVFVVIPSVAVD